MAGNSTEPGRTVISKLAAILMEFTSGRDYTLSELAMQTNLATSTVHRLLNDLVGASLLERLDGATYRPGPTLRHLPDDVRPPTLRARAPFVVEDLATSLHVTARLGMVEGVELAYVEKKAEPAVGTLFPNPARLPLHATAMGKVLLAFERRPLVRVVRGGALTRYTSRTITRPSELDRALQTVRARGFAVADGELHPTTSTVAVPVFDVHAQVVAAIEVDLPVTSSAAVMSTVPALLTAARCLRRELSAPHELEPGAAAPGGTADPVRRRA